MILPTARSPGAKIQLVGDNKKLDQAAKKILAILDDHAKDFTPAEQDAKWRAFSRAVAKVGTRARRAARPKTASSPRAGRKHA